MRVIILLNTQGEYTIGNTFVSNRAPQAVPLFNPSHAGSTERRTQHHMNGLNLEWRWGPGRGDGKGQGVGVRCGTQNPGLNALRAFRPTSDAGGVSSLCCIGATRPFPQMEGNQISHQIHSVPHALLT